MAIITLTTDWNRQGYYPGAIRGKLASICPMATVVDISHELPPFSKVQAAFIVKNCYHQFPEGTIHIIAIAPGNGQTMSPAIVIAYKQYFISWDNGIFALLFPENEEEQVIHVHNFHMTSFPELDVLAEIAGLIANGTDVNTLGTSGEDFFREPVHQPVFDKTSLTGNIVFFDVYGNGITNISRELFESTSKGRSFEICFGDQRVHRISEMYSDTRINEPFAIFNSNGLLETGLAFANLKTVCGLETNALIRILYID